ncbi:hypothetical protein HKX48_000516 [Thoreauomyces humboldtii]|nr:hypothetical protein HKX48_000516 [Thoreauomyces humboldtii]
MRLLSAALATIFATSVVRGTPSSLPHVVTSEYAEVGVAASLAPLEPPSKLLFGAWLNFIKQADSPTLLNQRFGQAAVGVFQSNFNIPEELGIVQGLIDMVDATNSDAIMYLTVYPMSGLGNVTDDNITTFGNVVQASVLKGRKFMIRYAPEMNGDWFQYGQKPTDFKAAWINFVTKIRTITQNSPSVAFLWAPNSANGYPYVGGEFSAFNTSLAVELDTNQNGVLDAKDDPYSPYYPGDQYVDWVGLSMYHYGKQYPWVDNVAPAPGQWEAMLTGTGFNGTLGYYNFYSMFSGDGSGGNVTAPVSQGGKPFFISETAATYHDGYLNATQVIGQETPINPGPGIVAIKQAWWQQIFNATVFSTYPKMKGVCFFEFRKQEETTLRDFRALGNPDPATFTNATDPENQVLAAFKADMLSMQSNVQWATVQTLSAQGGNGTSASPGPGSSKSGAFRPSFSNLATIAVAAAACLLA